MSEEPLRPAGSRQPTTELLLAHALDACIEAERQAPGSADEIIAEQPAWARDELRRLLDLACSLDAVSTSADMAEDFRLSAKARIMQRVSRDLDDESRPAGAPLPLPGARLVVVPSTNGSGYPHVRPRRSRRLLWRCGASLLTALIAGAATLTASASALPGQPLYGLKQAQEELGVRLAGDDQSRALALLKRADARLDETARLLEMGRANDAALAAHQYDTTVQHATTTFVVSMDESPSPDRVVERLAKHLDQQQEQLHQLLRAAPEPARANIREALVATERGRALVADPLPVERALGRPYPRPAAAAPVQTPEVEIQPTVVATAVPTQVAVKATATPVIVLAIDNAPPVNQVQRRNEDEDRGRGDERRPAVITANGAGPTGVISVSNATTNTNRGRGAPQVQQPQPPTPEPDRAEDVVQVQAPVPSAVVARGEGSSDGERGQPRGGRDDNNAPPAPVVARTNPASNESHNATSHKPTAPVVVVKPSQQGSGSGAATAQQGSGSGAATAQQGERNDARVLPTSAPAQAAKPQPTPTPNVAKRTGGDGTSDRSGSATSTRPAGTADADRDHGGSGH
jgi:hypothetical protein